MNTEEQTKLTTMDACALEIVRHSIDTAAKAGLSYSELLATLCAASHLTTVMVALPGSEARAVREQTRAGGEAGEHFIRDVLCQPDRVAHLKAMGRALGLEV